MNLVDQVVEFNSRVLGIAQRPLGCMPVAEEALTIKCLNEEIAEFCLALAENDYVGSIDALIDLRYFATGALYKLGLTPENIKACDTAVHEANMSKKLGSNAKRDTGAKDAVKPEDWVPPEARIHRILCARK